MPANGRGAVLTKDILFGMNVLSLAGFLIMGLSLTLHRTGNAGIPLSIGLMCAGTALVFYGLFSAASSNWLRQRRLCFRERRRDGEANDDEKYPRREQYEPAHPGANGSGGNSGGSGYLSSR